MAVHPFRVESDKEREINFLLLYPGSQGSGFFEPGGGLQTVFLDAELADIEKEGTRYPGIAYSSEPVLRDEYGSRFGEVDSEAYEEVGSRANALFFERVISKLFGEEVEIKHILTGVTGFTGKYWHDFGYVPVPVESQKH